MGVHSLEKIYVHIKGPPILFVTNNMIDDLKYNNGHPCYGIAFQISLAHEQQSCPRNDDYGEVK